VLDEPIDRVVRTRRDVMECPPVIRNENSPAQPLEQHQRVVVGEVPTAKSRALPPRRISNGQERDVERPAAWHELAMHELVRIGHQRGISREEARLIASVEEVHVRGAAPTVEAITIPAMCRQRRVNVDVSDTSRTARREILGVLVPTPSQPFRDYRRSEKRNVARQRVERTEREMIGVRMRQQQRIEMRQTVDRYTRWRDAGKKPSKLAVEVWIGQ
jgi:hypothetical protein